MAKVALTRVSADLYSAVVKAVDGVGQAIINTGDRVLLKPNLVNSEAPDSGMITSPGVIEAVCPLLP